jgi:hypothetical protein
MWSLLVSGRKIEIFEKKVVRKIFGPEYDEILYLPLSLVIPFIPNC